MKEVLLFTLLLGGLIPVKAQKVDSIFFHLYTDSLKKGTHNYINVDGKMSDGRWKPLSAREIDFSSSAFEFSGNELIIPADCREEKVTVKAVLKSDPRLAIERTIWIKKLPDPPLPSKDEILRNRPKRKSSDR